MKNLILGILFACLFNNYSRLCADVAYLGFKESGTITLNPGETDSVRENLIHIFDSSNFHQMSGSALPEKPINEIKEKLSQVKLGTYIQLDLSEVSRIVVERAELKVTRMWVSIRESDGFVYDWIFQKPDGDLVSLQKARGDLVVQFAPYILHLLEKNSEKIAPE